MRTHQTRSGRSFLLASMLAAAACGAREPAPEIGRPFEWPIALGPTAILEIEGMGEIHIALYPELAPRTVENFIELASQGFYDRTTFHRVIPGFMIQGGDPNSRDNDPGNDGEGGPGYRIEDEFTNAPHERGAVSMANLGLKNSGGSQFFVVHRDATHLDGKHSVFGRVTAGMEVIDAITEVETDEHGRWGPRQRPIENVTITKLTISPRARALTRQSGEAPPQTLPGSRS